MGETFEDRVYREQLEETGDPAFAAEAAAQAAELEDELDPLPEDGWREGSTDAAPFGGEEPCG